MRMSGQIYSSGSPEAASAVRNTVLVAIVINSVFAAAKLAFGIAYQNTAVLADAVYTFCAALLSLHALMVQSAGRRGGGAKKGILTGGPAAALLSFLIFCAGVLFIVLGAMAFMRPKAVAQDASIIILIVLLALSIAAREALFHFTVVRARGAGSLILRADATRLRIDALASAAVLGGLICVLIFGDDAVLSAAAMAVGAFIAGAALLSIRNSLRKFLKKSVKGKQNSALANFILGVSGVHSVGKIELRPFGNSLHADVEIYAEPGLQGLEIKELQDAVAAALENQTIYDIKRCFVTVRKKQGMAE